jgi:hypothetical protein
MHRAVAILLGVAAALSLLIAGCCGVAGPIGALGSLEGGPNDPPAWFSFAVYWPAALIVLARGLFQATAAFRVWHGAGWMHAIIASVLTVMTGLMCCSTADLVLGGVALVLLFGAETKAALGVDAAALDDALD